MKERYELHINGEKIESESYADILKITENKKDKWELYLIRDSRMNSKNFMRNKMTEIDIEEALRLMNKGTPKEILYRKYHVHESTFRKTINEYKNAHCNIR